jgi:integrase
VQATQAPKPKVARRRLTLEEFLAIRARAAATRPWLVNAMNLALLTGQREDDISQMKHTDYIDGSLYVVQGKSRGATRLQLAGAIHLSAAGVSVQDVVKACRGNVVSAYLVHHGRKVRGRAKAGGKIPAGTIGKVFSEIRDALKITAEAPRTPPSFHEIRSLAERLYEDEYGRDYAQMIMGHKNIETTATYNDLRGAGWKVVEAR